MKKILKWLGIVLAALVGLIALVLVRIYGTSHSSIR